MGLSLVLPPARAQIKPNTLATRVDTDKYSGTLMPDMMLFISGMPEPDGLFVFLVQV
jgi:hypothetical protein